MRKLFLSILSLMAGAILFATPNDYVFQPIGQADGISSYVQCMGLDRGRVLVWVGTDVGISRFNGYQARTFRLGAVSSIEIDKEGGLWCISPSGLYRFDDEKEDFLPVSDSEGLPVKATSMCRTENGLVFAGKNCMYRYSPGDGEVRRCGVSKERPNIAQMLPWEGDVFICANRWQKPVLINSSTGEISPTPFEENRIRAMAFDSEGNLWMAPYNGGVKCYDKKGNLLHSFNTSNSSLSTNIIVSLLEIGGRIAAGSDGEGIYLIDPKSGEIENIRHEEGNPNSLPANSILCLGEDSKGCLWAGSVRGGIVRIKKAFARFYTEVPYGVSYGISEKTVNCIREEGDGRVWIGTDGGGVDLFDAKKNTFKHITSTRGMKVSSIAEGGKDFLIISVFGKGLYRLGKTSGEITPITVVDEKTNQEVCRNGLSVYLSNVNGTGNVLLLCGTPYRYDPESGVFTPLAFSGNGEVTRSLLPLDKDGSMGYFYDSRNIYLLSGDTFAPVYTAPADTLMSAAAIDGNGTVWVGDEWGLTRVDLQNSTHRRMHQALVSSVRSLTYNNKGSLWIGTDGQLFAYGINTGKLRLFGRDDGIFDTGYITQAAVSDKDGNSYLGTVSGLLHLEGIPEEKTESDVHIELKDVLCSGEKRALKKGKLKIRERDLPLEINVRPRGKDIFSKPVYRFDITGSRKSTEYVFVPTYRLMTMPPGRYEVKASCSDRDTEWTEVSHLLTIVVKAPVYKRPWFLLLCLAMIAAVAYSLIRRNTTRQRHRMDIALKEQEIRNEEEKVRFLININHELRTPLTLIHTPLKQILSSLTPYDRNYALLSNVTRQSEKMKKLLDMVLDVRKMEVAQSTLTREDVPLKQWLDEVIEDFLPEASSRRIGIVTELSGAPESVCIDKAKCSSILGNLLSNSLKYSPDDSTIVVDAIAKDDMVKISVSDQGRGLSGVDMEHLFDRFYQGTGSKPGTGIGLAYCKILCEQQGGSIGAKDNGDTPGSTFWFTLPMNVAPGIEQIEPNSSVGDLYKASEDVSADYSSPTTEGLSDKTILLVEDNDELLSYLRDSLCTHFKEVYTAANGAEALKVCIEKAPGIVVSDVMMPVMDGFELCRSIKENIQISHIPVVLLTAMSDDKSRMGGYKCGADAYLTKPFEMEGLLTVISSIMSNRQRMREQFSKEETPLPMEKDSTFSPADETFLKKLNQVIDDNIDREGLDVETLYTMLAMGRSAFYGKLKAITGMSPNDYLTRRRIDKAVDLLKNSTLRINEISDACGFSTQRYFSTVFKQYMNCTPSQFRNSDSSE